MSNYLKVSLALWKSPKAYLNRHLIGDIDDESQTVVAHLDEALYCHDEVLRAGGGGVCDGYGGRAETS